MRIVFLCIILFSCMGMTGQSYIGDDKEIAVILENIKSFSKHVMGSDYQMIGESYTEDAKIFPNNRNIIEGKEKIVEYWTLPEGVQITHHKIIPSEIRIVADTAYDYGYYEGATKKPNGEEVTWKGKYVIVWKKSKGQWKIYLDIWNNLSKK